jgi:hypothetical protein
MHGTTVKLPGGSLPHSQEPTTYPWAGSMFKAVKGEDILLFLECCDDGGSKVLRRYRCRYPNPHSIALPNNWYQPNHHRQCPKSSSMSPLQTEETHKLPVSTVRHRGTSPLESSLVSEKSWCITLLGIFVTSDMIGCGPATEKRKERVVEKSVVRAECLLVRQV